MKLTVGEHTFTPVVPTGFGECYEVAMSVSSSQTAAFGAALGVCWSGAGAPAGSLARSHYNATEYGIGVVNELVDRGIPVNQVLAAGLTCWTMVAAVALPSADEVDATEDFTDPTGGESTT